MPEMSETCPACGRELGATANMPGRVTRTPRGWEHVRCPLDEPEDVGTAVVAAPYGWSETLGTPRPWVRIYGESPNRWVSTDDQGNLMALTWDGLVPTRWQPEALSPETVAEAVRVAEEVTAEEADFTTEPQAETPHLDHPADTDGAEGNVSGDAPAP